MLYDNLYNTFITHVYNIKLSCINLKPVENFSQIHQELI